MSQENNDPRSQLEEAGWELEETEDGPLWLNPEDDHLYEEQQALDILKGSGGMTPE